MRPLSHLLLSCLLLLFAVAGTAEASTESPESAVREYLADFNARGLAVVSSHMHSEELVRFKSMLLPVFQPGSSPNHKEFVSAFFGPNATPEAVAAMPPAAFMDAFMKLVGRELSARNVRFGQNDVVGSVQEGDVTHVVVRSRAGAGEINLTQMEVVSVRKEGPRWRILLTGSLEGMIHTFRSQSQRRP